MRPALELGEKAEGSINALFPAHKLEITSQDH